MFISEQYGWCSELSGDYWAEMQDYGCYSYSLISFHEPMIAFRDVDLMLIGL